jgi:hypothetical protein
MREGGPDVSWTACHVRLVERKSAGGDIRTQGDIAQGGTLGDAQGDIHRILRKAHRDRIGPAIVYVSTSINRILPTRLVACVSLVPEALASVHPAMALDPPLAQLFDRSHLLPQTTLSALVLLCYAPIGFTLLLVRCLLLLLVLVYIALRLPTPWLLHLAPVFGYWGRRDSVPFATQVSMLTLV